MSQKMEQEARHHEARNQLLPTAFLTLCFVISSIVGCFAVTFAEDIATCMLSSYLRTFLSLFAGEASIKPSIWAVAWELCRWPVLVIALGSTLLGTLAIPLVFCVRGFLLTYSISAFICVFGTNGVLGAVAVFGIPALVGVPVLFAVGFIMFPASLRQATSAFGDCQPGLGIRSYIVRLAPCGMLTVLAVVFQWSFVPSLLGIVSTLLLTS